jgi:dsRNA-specific ribonuclease
MHLKDFKTQLQERLQKFGQTLPQYDLIKTVGKDHNAKFTINCFLKDQYAYLVYQQTPFDNHQWCQ